MAQYVYDLSLKIPKPRFKTFLELIKLTFGVFFKCFGFIAFVVLIVELPLVTIREFIITTDITSTPNLLGLIYLKVIFSIVSGALSLLVSLSLLYGLVGSLQNTPMPSVGEAFRFGLRKWRPFIITQIRVAFYFLLYMLPPTLIGFPLISQFKLTTGWLYVIPLCIPSLMVGFALSFTEFAVCFESYTGKDPLTRSRELTRGNRWLILFISLVMAVPEYFYYLIEYLSHLSWFPHFDNPVIIHGMNILDGCIDRLLGTLILISLLLIYLKVVKEKKKKMKESRLLYIVP